MNKKKIFNLDSKEQFNGATILNGDPSGIFSFNQTNHLWANTLYENMLARTWFPKQVNVAVDKTNYNNLIDSEKRMYDLVLAQLITNDSIQTNQLMDSINQYITSPIVNACIARQTFEESLHSQSYAVMAEDICGDTDRIYDMHNHDNELFMKNKAVQDMYGSLYSGDNPSDEDILVAFGANQILEELVFPGGFVALFSLDKKMPGTVSMIVEIAKDETLSHVPLFKNIFRAAISESFDGVVPADVQKRITNMVIAMTNAEKRWTKYVTKGVLGFSDNSIDIFVESKANSVMKNLGLPLIYREAENNPLGDLLNKFIRGGDIKTRSAFFEKNVVDYSKGTLEVDF
jgi:ribonucleoside-diphosphate reductase beta chain